MSLFHNLPGAIWRASQQLATITPAASLWTSGIGLGSYQEAGGGIWIAYEVTLLLSHPPFCIKLDDC